MFKRRTDLLPGPWVVTGARKKTLADCPSEWAFYNTLAVLMLIVAGLDGFSAALAASYAFRLPLLDASLVGIGYGLTILWIDRALVLSMTSRKKVWGVPFRGLITIVAALMFAVVLSLTLFARTYAPIMGAENQHAAQVAKVDAERFYNPRIVADQAQITKLRAAQNQLQSTINENRFKETCEAAGTPDCGTTHKVGCGPFCRHYEQLVTTEKRQLTALKSQDAPRIAALKQTIKTLRHRKHEAITAARTQNLSDTGLIARQAALTQLENRHPQIKTWMWLWIALAIGIDLVPIVTKLQHVWSGDSPYEKLLKASRRMERTQAKGVEKAAEVEEGRVEEQGEADKELAKVKIQAERDRRMDEAIGFGRETGDFSDNDGTTVGEPIDALSLDEYLDLVHQRHVHEREPVPVPRDLRRGAIVGAALLAALAIVVGLVVGTGAGSVAGVWLVLAVVAPVAAFAVYTRGFRRASQRGLWACFGVLLAGLLMPFVIVGLNV